MPLNGRLPPSLPQVFFYKRAQIFVADLWGAFHGMGLGEFADIAELTMFAVRIFFSKSWGEGGAYLLRSVLLRHFDLLLLAAGPPSPAGPFSARCLPRQSSIGL